MVRFGVGHALEVFHSCSKALVGQSEVKSQGKEFG